MKIDINKLNAHLLNNKVYGFDENIEELSERIRQSGWVKPIIINRENLIISGHRRVAACKILNINEIEFEYAPDDTLKQLELFVGENYYREKTNLQKAQEAKIYMEIEQHKAYNRMNHIDEPVESLPQAGLDENEVKGRTRDIVGEKVGLSGRSLNKAQNVLEKIDNTYDETFVEFFKDTLNENIDAASKLASKPDEIIQEVIERTDGDPKKVSGVIRDMEKEQIQENTPLPPGKYQIFVLDITNRIHISMLSTTISEICEPDCVLFTWVRPEQVEMGIRISKNWGFRYQSCFLWQRDTENVISDEGEICLVSVKGSPHSIFERYPGAAEKPDLLKKVIDIGYKGWSRVEIFKDDGWQIW